MSWVKLYHVPAVPYAKINPNLFLLEHVASSDMDKSGKTWYYALCVDFQLELGLTIITYRQCEQYYQEMGSMISSLRDPSAEKRYFVNMWLW